jgi:hypothetical protein
MDIQKLFREAGLPVGLVAVVVAVLSLIGVELDQVLAVAAGLIGVPFFIQLVVNVLKVTGVVADDTAGKWSAVFNLIVLGLIVYALKAYPQFDFGSADKQIGDFARFASLCFVYIVQVVNTKQWHNTLTRGLGLKSFSFSLAE